MCKPLLYLFGLFIVTGAIAQPSNTGGNAYNEGIKLKNAEKYNEALAAFKDAVEKNPDNSDALFEAGWLCNELKEYDNAITYLQEAKQLKTSPEIFFELGYAYQNLSKNDAAKENYKKALELYPKYYDADKHLGDIYYDEQNYAMALNYFKKYFEATKTPDTYYYYKASRCSNESKDYADALLYLEKYDPSSREEFGKKYTEMGYAYLMTGYNDDAINAYQNALAANPHYGVALRGIADVYYNNLEDYNKALEYFTLALQNDEENSRDCYYKSGWIYLGQGKYDAAITFLQKAAVYDANDPVTREQLGYAYFMQNKYDSAISWFNSAIALNAQSKVSYYFKGICYATLGQKANSMEAYTQLKAIDKKDADKLLKEIKEKEKILKALAANNKSKKQADESASKKDGE